MKAASIPRPAAIRPFATDLPTTAAMKDMERMMSAVFSGRSRNASTSTARKGAQTNSVTSETVSPDTDEKWAIRSALPDWPLRVIGWPSQVVSRASGVPGVLNRMAGTAPPTVAPFMTPIRKPSTGSSAAGS